MKTSTTSSCCTKTLFLLIPSLNLPSTISASGTWKYQQQASPRTNSPPSGNRATLTSPVVWTSPPGDPSMLALLTFNMHRSRLKSTWKILLDNDFGGRCASFWRPNSTKETHKCLSESRRICLLNWTGL
uniref:Uncharacterized protein n=1 Tax=Cacopsylla melanoneura TaxID=428564 RepID=A0A8D9FF36_9HEMI